MSVTPARGRQLSLFGVEARPPAPLDLEGLLVGSGQVGRMGGTGRVSIVVEDAWRCAVLRAEFEQRGLAMTCEPTGEEGRWQVRTAYSAALAPLAARWLDAEGVKRAPAGLALEGRRLRLWVAAGGEYDGQRAYLLRLTPKPRPPEPEPGSVDASADGRAAGQTKTSIDAEGASADGHSVGRARTASDASMQTLSDASAATASDARGRPAGDAPRRPAGDASVETLSDAAVATAGDAPGRPAGDASVETLSDAAVATAIDSSTQTPADAPRGRRARKGRDATKSTSSDASTERQADGGSTGREETPSDASVEAPSDVGLAPDIQTLADVASAELADAAEDADDDQPDLTFSDVRASPKARSTPAAKPSRADKPNKRRRKSESQVTAFDPGPDEFADLDPYGAPDEYAEVDPFIDEPRDFVDEALDEWPDSGIADLPTVTLDAITEDTTDENAITENATQQIPRYAVSERPEGPAVAEDRAMEDGGEPVIKRPVEDNPGLIDRRIADNWLVLGEALVAIGLPAVFIAPDEGGPAYRIVGPRRITHLAELVGEPPADAPADVWPR